MTKANFRQQRQAERLARRKRNTVIASIAGIIILAVITFVIIQNLPGKVDADAIDTSFPIRENAVQTSSGLVYQDLQVGEGPAAKVGDTVSIIYTGYLPSGSFFDSNVETGKTYEFVLGTGAVIKGWDEGIVGMQVGGARMLFIPPELAVGASDPFGSIPENTTLTYSITLKEIK